MWLESIKKRIIENYFNRRLVSRIKKEISSREIYKTSDNSGHGLLVVPCDPFTIVGSRGDEAMIETAISHFKNKYPCEKIHFVGYSGHIRITLKRVFPDLDFQYDKCIAGYDWSFKVMKYARKINPRQIVIPGADCMDGAWSANLSINLLGVYLMARREGFDCKLLGFSYNNHPIKIVNKAFKSLGKNSIFNLRDKYSKERFERYTKCKASLVADSAFGLTPVFNSEIYTQISEWVGKWRLNKINSVIGFNFHPMLHEYNSADDVKEDAYKVARILYKILAENHDIAIILIPHDDRAKISDGTMLNPIYEILSNSKVRDRVKFIAQVPRARELKGCMQLLDGVITSRMHLGVAALGMKKPVMAGTYQGKFEGLFNHFGLPEELLCSPDDFIDDYKMSKLINTFVNQIDCNRERIIKALPDVCMLSENNFV